MRSELCDGEILKKSFKTPTPWSWLRNAYAKMGVAEVLNSQHSGLLIAVFFYLKRKILS
jgi:hypothetical protein